MPRAGCRQSWYYITEYVMEGTWNPRSPSRAKQQFRKLSVKHLGLEPGDRVKFFVHPDGSVVLLPKLSASAVRGMVKSRNPRSVTSEQMTAAVAEGALSRNPRRRHR